MFSESEEQQVDEESGILPGNDDRVIIEADITPTVGKR